MPNLNKKFSKIYDKSVDKIYRFIFLKVSSADIAQDLASETFLRGWEAYKKNPKIKNPSAFLYRIANNLVIDHYREKAKNQFVSPEVVPIADPNPGVEEKVSLAADIAQVKVVLADLREDYQNVIIWRYLDDLPLKQVAELANKSESTTRVTLHRAMKALKEGMRERAVKEG